MSFTPSANFVAHSELYAPLKREGRDSGASTLPGTTISYTVHILVAL